MKKQSQATNNSINREDSTHASSMNPQNTHNNYKLNLKSLKTQIQYRKRGSEIDDDNALVRIDSSILSTDDNQYERVNTQPNVTTNIVTQIPRRNQSSNKITGIKS